VTAFLVLFGCLGLGLLAGRGSRLPAGSATAIKWWVLYAALPSLVLALVPHVKYERGSFFLVAAMWAVFAGAWVLFAALGRAVGWSRERVGALVLVAGLGNTSFVGYPLIEALHGEQGLTRAVVCDQLGSFPLLAAGGVVVGSIYSGGRPSVRAVVRRVVTFPAFLALLVALLVHPLGGWPAAVESALLRVGQTLSPLALFAVGLELRVALPADRAGALAAGLAWKLVAAPLVCWGLGWVLGARGLTLGVGVLEAGMAPMISAAILASEYGLEPRLTSALIGIGILVSFATVPLLNLWLG
jgi:predicted permease